MTHNSDLSSLNDMTQNKFSCILQERDIIMSLLTELIIRVIIIISVTDAIEFYVIYRDGELMSGGKIEYIQWYPVV